MAEWVVVKQLQVDILKASVAEKSDIYVDVVVHESIDSTNSWSLQQCKLGKTLPFACFAEEQTAGRGRRGKQWIMSAHANIAMSITWPFALSYQQLHLLPLSIAIAIAETLEILSLKHVQIKWPNDVFVQGKKIAGVLIETQPIKGSQIISKRNEERFMAVVIGVGLNYDASELKLNESQVMPDLADFCGELRSQMIEVMPDRTSVASALLSNIINMCQNFQQDSKQYLEKFRTQYDYCKEKNVEIILDNKEIVSGVAHGINDNAELLVWVDGKERVFNSAEVSVKTGHKL